MTVKEELKSVKCRYSIEFSGELCRETADGRCTTEKSNDLLGPEPTTEPVTSCQGVPVLLTQKLKITSPTTRSKSSRAATIFLESFQTPTATLPRTSADVARLAGWSRRPAGKGTTEASRPRSCAMATPATPTVPGLTPT